MVSNLIQFSLLMTIVYYLAGIYGGGIKGKVYDNSFASATLSSAWQRTVNGIDTMTGRVEPSKDSLPELAKKNIEAVKESLPKDSPVLASKDNKGNIDPRLALCAMGSVNSQSAQDLSDEVVKQLKNGKFKTLWDVQAVAGLPACIKGTDWVYLGPDFTVLTVIQEKGKVSIK